MNIIHSTSSFILICNIAGFSNIAYCQEDPTPLFKHIELLASIGPASTDESNFNEAAVLELGLRYIHKNSWPAIDIGFAQFDKFEHTSSNSTYVDIGGYLLGFSKSIPITERNEIDVSTQLYYYKSQAVLQGLDKGTKKDTSPSVRVNWAINLNTLSITAGFRWYHDVSGVEIISPTVGIKWKI